MDLAHHLVLPVVVLGTGAMAGLVRVLRAEFLDKSNMPFVTTARAKGLSNTVVNYKHILRNAMTPFVAGFRLPAARHDRRLGAGRDHLQLPRHRPTHAQGRALLRHLPGDGELAGERACCWSSATCSPTSCSPGSIPASATVESHATGRIPYPNTPGRGPNPDYLRGPASVTFAAAPCPVSAVPQPLGHARLLGPGTALRQRPVRRLPGPVPLRQQRPQEGVPSADDHLGAHRRR